MNFSLFLVLVILSLRLVLGKKCSNALHEAFRRELSNLEKCDDCVILDHISFGGGNWAGFCAENQLHLFREWKCKQDNELFNIIEPYAMVANEDCQVVKGNFGLDEKCLKMFNYNMCNRRSGIKNQSIEKIRTGVAVEGTSSWPLFGNETGDIYEIYIKTTATTKKTTTTPTKGRKPTSTKKIPIDDDPIESKTSGTNFTANKKLPNSRDGNFTFIIQRGNCEIDEYFFEDHCYFFTAKALGRSGDSTSTSQRTSPLTTTTTAPSTTSLCSTTETTITPLPIFTTTLSSTSTTIPLHAIDSTDICQSQHPKALGLAVETKEENAFIMKLLRTLKLYDLTILTSGVGGNFSPHIWNGWNLSINQSILHFEDANRSIKYDFYYSINASKSVWYLISGNKMMNSKLWSLICERPYNPKSVHLELHKRCIEQYRKSSCYNPKKHASYCCEKDETGELWFACPFQEQGKFFPNGLKCKWRCGEGGVFVDDRPDCNGVYICDDSYNGIRYVGPTTRYAVSSCPARYWGESIWYCGWNRTFLGTPDYSFCCENANPHRKSCRDTDPFLNVWRGCPSKNVKKKTACPPGRLLDKALVEWYCLSNGSFHGTIPDYSNCNIPKTVNCKKKDRFDREWQAEFGKIVHKNCPDKFTGLCSWYCKESGKFDGPEPDCSKCIAEWMTEITDKIKNQENHTEVMEVMENYTECHDLTIGYANVLNLTAECVKLYKKQVSGSELDVFEKFLKSYSKILRNVAGNPSTWSNFSVLNRKEYSEKIIETTQTAAFANLRNGNQNRKKYNETFARSQVDGFDFFVAYNPSVGTRFPLENFPESDWHLDIKEINERNPSFAAMGLVMNYSLSSLMFPQGNQTEALEINAPVVTFTVAASSRDDELVTDPNVVVSLSFKHRNRTRMPETVVIRRRLHEGEQPSGVFNSTLCFYYRDSDWTSEGCSVTFTSRDRTNCTCNHLSTIGVLMSIHKYEPNLTLEVVSTVSSAITIISLLFALLVFFFFDKVGNLRLLIGKNLCFCLLIGHVMLVTVLDKKFFNIPDNVCVVSAIALHYVFMAAFAWMFVEGYHLYRMLIVVFDSGIEYRYIYILIGYGLPFVIVGVTQVVGLILQEQPYGQDEMCWLKSPMYVWAFVGPVIILTSINFCILTIAMKLAVASRRKSDRSNFATVMMWMKRWISLSALLGITWLFGLGYFNYNEPLVYIFVFFNGLQGFFIFLFRCVLSEQYKSVFLKKIKTWFSKSNSKTQKKTENVKSETKLYAISGSKSLRESKDSGYDPGIEDSQKNIFEIQTHSFRKAWIKRKSEEDSCGVDADADITPAMSEAYLRSRIISGNFSIRKTKATLLTESDNFTELSYHNINNPN